MNKTRMGLYVFIFFMAFYAFFSIGHFGGDGYEDYLTAESIVLDGDLSIMDRPDDPDELGYKTVSGIKGRGGKLYSSRGGVIVPALLSIFYLAGHLISLLFKQVPHDLVTMMAVSFYNPVISAFSIFLIFLISGRLGFKTSTGIALSFIYGLATMAPVYARTGFAEPTLVLFLLAGIYWAIRYKDTLRPRDLIVSACIVSSCMLVKAAGIIFVPCVFLYLVWIILEGRFSRGGKALLIALFIMAAVMIAGITMTLNWYVYGKVLSFGGYHAASNAVRIIGSSHFLKGIYYYLVSTGKGFFIYNLPLILILPVIISAVKDRKKEAVLFILIMIINVSFYSKSFRRGSLFSWGPRYLLPSVSVMIFMLGYHMERFRDLFSRISLWVLSIAGVLVMFPCMIMNQSKFYFFVVEKLGMKEYMINFIPDLSPIRGVWHMLLSNVIERTGQGAWPFIYAPDWRLVEPVSAVMNGYNYVDLWFVKVINIAPQFQSIVFAVLAVLALAGGASLYKIVRDE